MTETIEANATRQQDTPQVSAKPRLLDQVRQVIRVKHYSLRTEKTYISWVTQFIRWSGMRHPADMGAPEVEAFLSMLANQRDVAGSKAARLRGLTCWGGCKWPADCTGFTQGCFVALDRPAYQPRREKRAG